MAHLCSAYGKACVNPAIYYYQQRLNDSMKIPMQVFKAAHFFVPAKVQEMRIDAQALDSLSVFPFFDTVEIAQIKLSCQTTLLHVKILIHCITF